MIVSPPAVDREALSTLAGLLRFDHPLSPGEIRRRLDALCETQRILR